MRQIQKGGGHLCTSLPGTDRAFGQLMLERPGANHFDSGEAVTPENCGTCRFYRPRWRYQFCVFEKCPYQQGKLTALDAVSFQVNQTDRAKDGRTVNADGESADGMRMEKIDDKI